MSEPVMSLTAKPQTNSPRVTVKDIAREMGVSIATVSRAFSNDSTIAEKTREKVLPAGARIWAIHPICSRAA